MCASCRCADTSRCCVTYRACWRCVVRSNGGCWRLHRLSSLASMPRTSTSDSRSSCVAAAFASCTTSVRRYGPGAASASTRSAAQWIACCWCSRSSSASTTRPAFAATYVGHPLASMIPMVPDAVAARARLGLEAPGPLVAVLPGSRADEVHHLGPTFFMAMARLRESRSDDPLRAAGRRCVAQGAAHAYARRPSGARRRVDDH